MELLKIAWEYPNFPSTIALPLQEKPFLNFIHWTLRFSLWLPKCKVPCSPMKAASMGKMGNGGFHLTLCFIPNAGSSSSIGEIWNGGFIFYWLSSCNVLQMNCWVKWGISQKIYFKYKIKIKIHWIALSEMMNEGGILQLEDPSVALSNQVQLNW